MRVGTALVFILFLTFGFCQEYSFSRLTEEDGLPGNQANCFLKDEHGFIWIGTTSGLCRYDGYIIKSFTRNMGYEISDDHINSLIQDKDGIIWVGTNGGGLNKFDPRTETFVAYRHDPEDSESIAGERIRKLIEGDDDILWVAFDNGIGLSKFDKRTGKSTNYEPFQSITVPGVKAIRGMVMDSYNSNRLWLGTTSGLILFNISDESFQVIEHPLTKANKHGLFALEQIDENRLMAGLFHAGVDIYHIKEGIWSKAFTDPSEQLRTFDLARKSETEFWVSARRRGLAVYNINENVLNFVHSDLNNQSTPFPGFTYSVYSQGDQVWVGGKYGVSYSNKEESLFPFDSVSYSDSKFGLITTISGKYDKVYMSGIALNGIVVIDKVSNEKIFHSFGNEHKGFYGLLEQKTAIYLYNDKRELFVFNKSKGTLTKINIPLFQGQKIVIRGIREWTQTHAIVLTSYGSTWKLEFATNSLSLLCNTDDWQLDALVHEDGSVWIGGVKGITVFNPENNKTSSLNLKVIDSDEEKHIQALAKDKDGVIWVGTTRGLVKIDKGEETLYSVHNSDLSGNFIHQIAIDRDGYIWLNTQKGISKVDPSQMEVTNYDSSDGIDPEGALIAVEGEIYYGTYGGYFKITDPASRGAQASPNVHLSSFQVDNREFQMEQTINYTNNIKLEYLENSFSFSFSAPTYKNSEKIQYAYRLFGQDKDWITTHERRFASYTNLDGGQYTFQVKARIRDGDWGEIKSVNIYLAAPFWETWWFYLLCSLAVAGSVFTLYNLRVNSLQRKADQEAQELRLEAFQKRLTELNATPPDLTLHFDQLNSKLNNPLSEREFEVLELSLDGKTNSEIGNELFISTSTVKFHLRNTYSKLGVSNRKEALAYVSKSS